MNNYTREKILKEMSKTYNHDDFLKKNTTIEPALTPAHLSFDIPAPEPSTTENRNQRKNTSKNRKK